MQRSLYHFSALDVQQPTAWCMHSVVGLTGWCRPQEDLLNARPVWVPRDVRSAGCARAGTEVGLPGAALIRCQACMRVICACRMLQTDTLSYCTHTRKDPFRHHRCPACRASLCGANDHSCMAGTSSCPTHPPAHTTPSLPFSMHVRTHLRMLHSCTLRPTACPQVMHVHT